MRLLVTGGAGFIGSHFIRYILNKYSDYQIINIDKLTYAGDLNRLIDISDHHNYTFAEGDITDKVLIDSLASKVDVIVNFAAETHVDNSISNSDPFLITNILGTKVLMDAAMKHKHKRFVQISTDEVYGDILKGEFYEDSMLNPSSPYSVSKASAELLLFSYNRTYGFNGLVSRCSNNYGAYQFEEKLIPLFVKKLMNGEKVPVYGNGSNVRDWLHVLDHCSAIDLILHKGEIGEVYNISDHNEFNNLEITKKILDILGFDESKIEFVTDRPGHDLRYAVNSDKIRNELGWSPDMNFEESFKSMILWYKEYFNLNK